MHKKIMAIFFTLVLAATALIALGMTQTAGAVDEECEPREAWTETIEHEAITHEETVTVVDKEAWTETVFDHWQRYSWTGGFEAYDADNPPPFPHADWQPNTQSDPHDIGRAGAYFIPHGPHGGGAWFYLEAVTKTINHPAQTHEETVTVVDKEAWTEVIEHEAVTCEEPPGEPCPDDTLILNPETGECEPNPCPNGNCEPTDPTNPVDPTDEPKDDGEKPTKPSSSITGEVTVKCIGGALVTETFVGGDRVSVSTENGHADCAQSTVAGVPFKEEGM